SDENLLVGFDPIGVIVGELLQQIHGALRDEPVFVVGERRELAHARGILLDDGSHALRVGDASSIAAREIPSQLAVHGLRMPSMGGLPRCVNCAFVILPPSSTNVMKSVGSTCVPKRRPPT